MDTRRRSDSSERFGTSPSSPSNAQDDLGSETRVVRLSDMQPVEPRKGGLSPVLVITVVSVVVLAFAMGSGFKNLTAQPSPTPPPIAVVAATLPPTPAPSATLRPTPRPTAVPVTTAPTNAHSWTWDSIPFRVEMGSMRSGDMWAVGNRILLLGRTFDDFDQVHWKMASVTSGFLWDEHAVPPAITNLTGG